MDPDPGDGLAGLIGIAAFHAEKGIVGEDILRQQDLLLRIGQARPLVLSQKLPEGGVQPDDFLTPGFHHPAETGGGEAEGQDVFDDPRGPHDQAAALGTVQVFAAAEHGHIRTTVRIGPEVLFGREHRRRV